MSVEYHRQHYLDNKEVYLSRNTAYKAIFEAIICTLKSKPCMDCRQSFPPCAMDFDHVRGEKTINIATISRQCSPALLVSELKKCDLVCSNCHRIRTASRLNPRRTMSLDEVLNVLSKRRKVYDREVWIELLSLVNLEMPMLPPKIERKSRCVRKVGSNGMEWCRGCVDFVATARFEKNASRWNGLQGQCVDCRKKMPSRKPKKPRSKLSE